MKGMDANTGRMIDGVDHLRQSIDKCIRTPLQTRIGRRLFGSELFHLIDAPANSVTRLRLYAAVATVLMKYEPRLQLSRIGLSIDPATPGSVVIEVEGTTNISSDTVSVRSQLNISGIRQL